MKLLGIDYGEKRIGLAVSDESQSFARELNIYSPKEFWDILSNIIEENNISLIVIGWPLNMDGQPTKKTQEVALFKNKLQFFTKLPVVTTDERLSSVMASKLPGGNKNIDSLAAQIILQNWMDRDGGRGGKGVNVEL